MNSIPSPQLAARILFGESLELSAKQRQSLATLDLRAMPNPDGESWFESLLKGAVRELQNGRFARTSDWSYYLPPSSPGKEWESEQVWPEDFMPDQPVGWKTDFEKWVENSKKEHPRAHQGDTPYFDAPGAMETLAWYQPAHFYAPHEVSGVCGWGIVIPPAGIARGVSLLREKTPALNEPDAVRLAAKLLYYHECGHAIIEDLVCITEQGDGEFGNYLSPVLKNDTDRHTPLYFGRTSRGHLREEGFCNTLALACVRRDFADAKEPVAATVAWMRTQPPGYSHFDAQVEGFGSDKSVQRLAGMAWLVLWDYTSPEGRWNKENEAVEIRTPKIESSIDFAYGVRTAQLHRFSARRIKPREWPVGFIPVYSEESGIRGFRSRPSSDWLRVIVEESDGILTVEELNSYLKQGCCGTLADLLSFASLAAQVRTYEPQSALHGMKLFMALAGGARPDAIQDTVVDLNGAGFGYGDERITEGTSAAFIAQDCFVAASQFSLRKPSGYHDLLAHAGGGRVVDDLGETLLMTLARTRYCISDGKVWDLHGTDLNAKDGTGFTALMWAALFNHDQVAGQLLELERGADVNLQNNAGETALMLAAERGHQGFVEKLLGNGCVVEEAFETSCTAEIIAREKGHNALADCIRGYRESNSTDHHPKSTANRTE